MCVCVVGATPRGCCGAEGAAAAAEEGGAGDEDKDADSNLMHASAEGDVVLGRCRDRPFSFHSVVLGSCRDRPFSFHSTSALYRGRDDKVDSDDATV